MKKSPIKELQLRDDRSNAADIIAFFKEVNNLEKEIKKTLIEDFKLGRPSPPGLTVFESERTTLDSEKKDEAQAFIKATKKYARSDYMTLESLSTLKDVLSGRDYGAVVDGFCSRKKIVSIKLKNGTND